MSLNQANNSFFKLNLFIMIYFGLFIIYLFLAHYISYNLEKNRIVKGTVWGLNICCGKTNGGGVNADIVQHEQLPNFKLIHDIYALPFETNSFQRVLCSHTIEHVDHPRRFFNELQRVGTQVTLVVPPLYDLGAVFNIFEHKYIFLTFKKTHTTLPKHIKLPLAHWIQRTWGQINHA